jgi:hypothetical protein
MGNENNYSLMVQFIEDEKPRAILGAYSRSMEIDAVKLPEYIYDRVAMLKMTDFKKKGVLGRKITEYMFTIYLTYDEFKEIAGLNINLEE